MRSGGRWSGAYGAKPPDGWRIRYRASQNAALVPLPRVPACQPLCPDASTSCLSGCSRAPISPPTSPGPRGSVSPLIPPCRVPMFATLDPRSGWSGNVRHTGVELPRRCPLQTRSGPPSEHLQQLLCRVLTADHVAPESLPDPPQVLQGLPRDLQRIGVAMRELSGPCVREEPVLVLALTRRFRRGRAGPPIGSTGLDVWAVLLQ